MNKKDRVRAALRGEAVDHVPVSMWGHDFLREWSAEDLAAQTLESYRSSDWDFIKLNPRWTFFAEAWGNTYERPTEQRFPRLKTRVVQATADLRAIQPVDPAAGAFGEQLEALRLVLAGAPEAFVVYTLFSPLAVLGLLCGGVGEPLTSFAREDPAAVHTALRNITATLGRHGEAALQAGAAGVFFAPLQWSSRRNSTEEFYREFGRPYDLQTLDALRGAEFNILHVCGDDNLIRLLLDYPVSALNWADHGPGNPTLAEVRELTSLAVIGGIDQSSIHRIDAAEAAAEAANVLATAPSKFMLAAGCGISPLTSNEVKAAVVQAARG